MQKNFEAKIPSKNNQSFIHHSSHFSNAQMAVFILVFALVGFIIFKTFAINPNLQGDLNNDNIVNISDLSILLSNYGTTNATADLNSDGTVNITDLSILLSHFGQTYSGGGTTDIATESICPNQSNSGDANSIQVTAMICMTNYARQVDGGLGALVPNTALTNAAASKNSDIINCNDFSHTACGRAFDYYIRLNGYVGNCWGENIAYGYSTVHDTFVAWMNSSGHRANILNSGYRDIGEAMTNWPNHGPLWTTDFGGC